MFDGVPTPDYLNRLTLLNVRTFGYSISALQAYLRPHVVNKILSNMAKGGSRSSGVSNRSGGSSRSGTTGGSSRSGTSTASSHAGWNHYASYASVPAIPMVYAPVNPVTGSVGKVGATCNGDVSTHPL